MAYDNDGIKTFTIPVYITTKMKLILSIDFCGMSKGFVGPLVPSPDKSHQKLVVETLELRA